MRGLGFTILLLGLRAGTAASSAQQPSPPVILGVLEDVPGVYAGEANSPGVRVLFKKDGREWRAFPSDCRDQSCVKTISSAYPHEATWTISFDGKKLGQVVGQTPDDFEWYSHVGLQKVISALPVPVVGKRSTEYGGDSEVYRPLVASSQSFYSDPEHWAPVSPSGDLLAILRQQFRRAFPKLCRTNARDESKLDRFLYRNADVQVAKAYQSKGRWAMARLHLKGAVDCKDDEAGFAMDDPWFVIDPQKQVRYAGSGMWLVDAGDYDNDGASELLFSIDRYNRGGYVLFYDNFSKHVTFEFSYH